MHAFRIVVFSSVIAGLLVGLVITLAQLVGTAPLIQRAEIYERAAGVGMSAPGGAAPEAHAGHAHAADHAHEHAAWEPSDGLERTAYSAAANALTAIGFALLLCGAYELRGGGVTWRQGLLWGLAGFAVFVGAPSLGLPPELPGTPVAPLGPRQLWWVGTAAATALGLGLLVFRRSIPAAILAVALFALPHLIGAPQPAEQGGAVPLDLARGFVAAAVLTGLLFWLLLGGVTGAIYRRLSARREAGRTGLPDPLASARR